MSAVRDQAQLVATRHRGGDPRGQAQGGVVGRIDRDLEERGLCLVEELVDVSTGEAGGHESERGERRGASADVRVGVEHAVARFASGDVERRARVGHHDDALDGVDADVAERSLERAPLRVGLDRRAGLRRHHESGLLQTTVECGEDLARGRRVEDRERHAGGLGDHLGGERRAAHAREHDARHTLGMQIGAQGGDLGDQRTRDGHRLDPTQTDRRL